MDSPRAVPPACPRSLPEFEKLFPGDQECWDYLARVRWPNGFRCPRCGGDRAWSLARGVRECAACHHQASATAGTILDGTRKPLRLWFLAMWLVTNTKNGVSALALQRQLGIARYETVWTWLHKLRRAMVRPGRERLTGSVEVDETYVGGVEEGITGRGAQEKVLVVIAAEKAGRAIGRIRLGRVPDASEPALSQFVTQNIEPGAEVHTDGWQGYRQLGKNGYAHTVTVIRGSGQPAHVLMPRVHRVASLLKRWLLGTHQGAVGDDHLDYYLDEFTFRFNRRSSQHRGKLFLRLLEQVVAVGPVTWDAVANPTKRKGLGGPERTG